LRAALGALLLLPPPLSLLPLPLRLLLPLSLLLF
jgi:hypothetical protein